jgi:hypothetical protein
MKIPGDVARRIADGQSLGFTCDHIGQVQNWPAGHGIYPPVGYLRWGVLEVGNGDTYGYYWPVGEEDNYPIVCTTEHDDALLVPIASGLEGCLRLLNVQEPEIRDEVMEVARAFDVRLTGMHATVESDAGRDLAALDPHSPHLLLAAARESFRAGDLAITEERLKLSLDLLPEYAEASFALAQLYRRRHEMAAAAVALLDALGAPLCFGGYDLREKCLRSLQGLKDDILPERQDVLWRERKRLTLKTNVKHNDDYLIYEDAIAAYLASGQGVRAVWLRMLVGELMLWETISFQERYGWSKEKHRDDLRRDMTRARLDSRLQAVSVS